MDRNFLLAITLSIGVMVAWTLYTGGKKQHIEETAIGSSAPAAQSSAPAPAPTEAGETAGTAAPGPTPSAPAVAPTGQEQRIAIERALFRAELSSYGGGLRLWQLTRYDDPSLPGRPQVEMVTPGGDEPLALETPFEGLGFGNLAQASYQVAQPDADTVVFTRSQDGVTLRKTYRFEPDSYAFRLSLEVENGTDHYLRPTFRLNWPATRGTSADFGDYAVVAYSDGKLHQEMIHTSRGFLGMGGGGFDTTKEFPRGVDWAGAYTRYFVAALIPDVPRDAGARLSAPVPGSQALVEMAFQPVDLPPGQRIDREYRVYLGPKEADRLDALGAHVDEAIQKGWFPPLTRFFTRALQAVHSVIPNYGIAIILITIVVRGLMAPLMARQMRSMKRMGELQPKVKAVQEKYPDDRQKQSEAMMAVYKEAGVNPLSMMTGCLPMFLQLPVFVGFYYALQGAIQLRQQPFFGWIDDLSAPESIFTLPGLDIPVRVLPLLMGGSMVLQQKLSPSAMDPAQARMMMTIMPVMFTVMFYQFASGLVLYWLVSTLLGIAQQMYTNRKQA